MALIFIVKSVVWGTGVFDSDEHTSLLHLVLITNVMSVAQAVLALPSYIGLGGKVFDSEKHTSLLQNVLISNVKSVDQALLALT